MVAALPAASAHKELDPDGPQYRLLFDPSPEATRDWIETFLTIPNERGQIVRFKLFPQQWQMLQEHTGRDVTVKGRQTRASSLIIARNVRRLTTGFGLNALVMFQDDQTTELARARIKHHIRDLQSNGLAVELFRDNEEEIVIGENMQNRVIFGSGEERVAGRGFTGHIAHLSEVAHWKPETAAALLGGITPGVPGPPHGWFDLESTPNGAEGPFYDYAADAQDVGDVMQSWRLHFYSWWLEPRYRCGTTDDCDFRVTHQQLEGLLHSFDPSPRERHLLDRGLSLEQLLWRRWRERDLLKTGLPFLQEYVEDLESCFVTGTENFFSSPDGRDHLAYYRDSCREPATRMDSLPYRDSPVSFYGPNLSIWEYPDPKNLYVAFLDCAEGGQGKDHDYTALSVVNLRTLRHAATLRLKAAPSECGVMACAVATFYNRALLAGERGNYGTSALERIRDLNYPNVYYHTDLRNNKAPEPWFYTTHQIRDEILRVFREAVFEHTFVTGDTVLVGEMGTFDWAKVSGQVTRKARARRARHDDMVISAAGAVYVATRRQVYFKAHEEDQPRRVVVGAHGVVQGEDTGSRRQIFR